MLNVYGGMQMKQELMSMDESINHQLKTMIDVYSKELIELKKSKIQNPVLMGLVCEKIESLQDKIIACKK